MKETKINSMITEQEILDQIKEMFAENYELLRLEGGHSLTEDIKELALNQVIYYYKKMKDVATRVTDTEVKLTLPNQRTSQGREFTIEGIVDIIKEENETWMYDIKTHEPEYIRDNIDLYEHQLEVYSYIWQKLRKQELDHTAIISTSYPKALKEALFTNDLNRIETELMKWDPLIEIPLSKEKIDEKINNFAEVVDNIEDKKFIPAPIEKLDKIVVGTNQKFVTRVCRNCDARFSCDSYRKYSFGKGERMRVNMKKYFDDFGTDADKEGWISSNLEASNLDINS